MDGSSLGRAIAQQFMILVGGALIIGLLLGVGGAWACGKLSAYSVRIEKVEAK